MEGLPRALAGGGQEAVESEWNPGRPSIRALQIQPTEQRTGHTAVRTVLSQVCNAPGPSALLLLPCRTLLASSKFPPFLGSFIAEETNPGSCSSNGTLLNTQALRSSATDLPVSLSHTLFTVENLLTT